MTHPPRSFARALVFSATLSLAVQVHAATPAELIDQGLALREQGRDAEALALFEKAYASVPSPRAAAQVGLAHQALGNWVEAERFVDEALSEDTDPWIKKRRAVLASALTQIQKKLGSLAVVGTPAGAEVRFAGKAVGHLPIETPVRVVAQRGALVVSAPGHREVVRELEVKAGGLVKEQVVLDAIASGPTDRPRDLTDPSDPDDPLDTPERREAARQETLRRFTLRSEPRATVGVGVGFVVSHPLHYEQPPEDTFSQFYTPNASSPTALLRLDAGVRYALSGSWDLVAHGAFAFVNADALVLQLEAALGVRARPTSPISPWYIAFGALGGANVPLGDYEYTVRDFAAEQDHTFTAATLTTGFAGLSIGTGFMLDRDERWDLGLVIALRVDFESDEIDKQLAPSFELRLGHAF